MKQQKNEPEGLGLILGSLIITFFYYREQSEFKLITVIIIRLLYVWAIIKRTSKLNRSQFLWGIYGLVFSEIAIIILAFAKGFIKTKDSKQMAAYKKRRTSFKKKELLEKLMAEGVITKEKYYSKLNDIQFNEEKKEEAESDQDAIELNKLIEKAKKEGLLDDSELNK